MPNINTPALRHLVPAPRGGWQWLPFHDPTYRICLMHALNIIGERMQGRLRCTAAYRALPGGRAFADLWADATVWVSYDPGNLAGRFGASVENEITISQYACRMGMRVVAATLIHELLRTACGDGLSKAVEQPLSSCLLQRHYDPVLAEILARQSSEDPGWAARSPTLAGWS